MGEILKWLHTVVCRQGFILYTMRYNTFVYNNMKENEYLKQFSQRVRTLREEQGISQEKLAERSDLHRTYIGMVERLERNPSLVCIHKIANGLGVHVTELFK